MRELIAVAVTTAVLAACGPSIDKAMQQSTDSLLGKHASTGASFEVPTDAQIKPWAVGQWVIHRGKDNDGRPTVQRTAIIEQADCGFWLEFTTQSYTELSRARYCFSRQPQAADASSGERLASLVSLVEIETKDGQVSKMDLSEPQYAPMRSIQIKAYEAMFKGLSVDADQPREKVVVPAGTFDGTFRVDSQVKIGPITIEATSWTHSEVPVVGTVKSLTKDGKSEQELLAYGESGASKGDWP